MKNLLIWGANDQAIVTLDCAEMMKQYDNIEIMCFKEVHQCRNFNKPIYNEVDVNLEQFLPLFDEVIVATGNNYLREEKIKILNKLNIPLATIIHPSAIISAYAKVEAGCTILAQSVIHTNAYVKSGCIINTGVIVEHDCIIQEYVNLCPNVSIAGHTEIGKRTFVGIGSTIIDQITIENDVIVGAGSVVIKDILSNCKVMGVPTKNKK